MGRQLGAGAPPLLSETLYECLGRLEQPRKCVLGDVLRRARDESQRGPPRHREWGGEDGQEAAFPLQPELPRCPAVGRRLCPTQCAPAEKGWLLDTHNSRASSRSP